MLPAFVVTWVLPSGHLPFTALTALFVLLSLHFTAAVLGAGALSSAAKVKAAVPTIRPRPSIIPVIFFMEVILLIPLPAA